MVGVEAALGAASLVSGAIGADKAYEAYRTNRKRVGKTLKYGQGLYALRADAAMQAYLQSIGRAQEATQSALAETERLGFTGAQDLGANLQQQLAQNRQGAGSVLAQSSLMPAFNRGAYSDYRRDLGALRESIASRRAQIHQSGAQQEINATQALAGALFKRGQAEFQMQEALATRFGYGTPTQIGTPQPLDLSGLEPLFSSFGSIGNPFGGYEPTSKYSSLSNPGIS